MQTVLSLRAFRLILLPTVFSCLLSGCGTPGRGQRVFSQAQLTKQFDFYRSLVYEQAPELRGEPLVFTDGGSSGVVTNADDLRHTQYLRAVFRFERDTGSTYRFVDYERRQDDPTKPPKITLTIGRMRATHVIEQHRHKTTPGA